MVKIIEHDHTNFVTYIPECTCNKKRPWVGWKNDLKRAEAHEEMHKLAYDIMSFMEETGKMDRESIMEEFSDDYREPLIVIASTLILSPIKFPRRRHAPPAVFNEMKKQAKEITDRYLRMKEFDLEGDECDTTDDIRCEYHEYFF